MMDSGEAVDKADAIDIDDKILNYLNQNPGCTRSAVYREMSVGQGVVRGHLSSLIADGRVREVEKGRARLLFA